MTRPQSREIVAWWRPLLCTALLAACGSPQPVPDGAWNVTVTGVSTDCTTETSGYQKSFVYQIFYDETNLSRAEIDIEDEAFAVGTISGCNMTYESAVWLEEDSGGEFQWQITGGAEIQGAAGGCDIENDLDWNGTEVLEVVQSENPTVPEGCTYEMTVQGTWSGS